MQVKIEQTFYRSSYIGDKAAFSHRDRAKRIDTVPQQYPNSPSASRHPFEGIIPWHSDLGSSIDPLIQECSPIVVNFVSPRLTLGHSISLQEGQVHIQPTTTGFSHRRASVLICGYYPREHRYSLWTKTEDRGN